MSTTNVQQIGPAGLCLITRDLFKDDRGQFSKLFSSEGLAQVGWHKPIAQVNHSHTAKRGTVRGMHFQHPPHHEMKLVSCIRGEVWDVAVDLRSNSPTYLKWTAQILSAANGLSLLIPEGMAHGFQALSDEAEIIYCHSAPWVKDAEEGLNPRDPALAINWPLPISVISAKDSALPMIDQSFKGIQL
ncbi:MAG: dTDP-4-dehydrorhamnose 3,5-epimerase [Aestuariivirga sp.]